MTTLRSLYPFLSLSLTAVLVSACGNLQSAHVEKAQISNIPVQDLAYDITPEGVAFAPLDGNRFDEPYMAMVRLPAGLESPAHVKSANMFGVMISGSMTHSAVGTATGDEVILPPGSYYKIPAGMKHVSKCVSDVECVTFLYQDGRFDFQPVSQ